MPSTFFGLQIGTTGLMTYRTALDVSAHNISNAGTEGYTRQQALQKAGAAIPVRAAHGMVGTGVQTTGIVQIRDIYYDIKFWNNTTLSGEYSTKSYYLDRVETHFNELELETFTNSYAGLINGLQDLTKDNTSSTARIAVGNHAQTMAEYFNMLATQLNKIQDDANTEIKMQVDKLNSLAERIASINQQIKVVEASGFMANDLRDQRALLIDELSEIASVSVNERTLGDSERGTQSYEVRIDGHLLVRDDQFEKLKVVAREEKKNLNDIDGLYDVQWENGEEFDCFSPSLGGTLQALFQTRDGNNAENLKGMGMPETADANQVGSKKIIMNQASINDIKLLNIPTSGVIRVGNKEYHYENFEVEKQADGTYQYTFELKDGETLRESAAGKNISIGDSVSYKGVPHYQAQINEFVRTFSAAFNQLHKSGQDLNGEKGLDFFNGRLATGENFILEEDPVTFRSDQKNGNYYLMTAANFTVTDAVAKDPNKVVTTSDITQGKDQNDIALKLIELQKNKGMFKQGTPEDFLHMIIGEVGVDTQKVHDFAKAQKNIVDVVANQRLSVSGVDEEEEGINLMKYQYAYGLSAKVISVMDEIYDKLINGMAV